MKSKNRYTLFELFQKNEADSYLTGFTTSIMKCYQIADTGNKEKLEIAFPDYFKEKCYQLY